MEPDISRQRGILVAIFVTTFLDLVGFSIIFPLFPQMLDYYFELEGPSSTLGRGVSLLAELAGDRTDGHFLVVVLFGGFLGSIYSALQFAFAPIWGSVSDRLGRRKTLIVTLAGTVLSYVGWFFAGTFPLLVLSRLVGGMMSGNISTASAVVADVTRPSERSKGMAVIGMAIGLGFIIGPALGGFASLFDFTKAWPGLARFGVNPFSGAAAIALLLALANFALVVARLPETNPGGGARTGFRTANPFRLFRSLDVPGLRRANAISFAYLTAFASMEFTLVFLAVERFGFTPRQSATMFVFIGVIIAGVQGGLVRRLGPRFGDRMLVRWGLVAILPGFVLIGLAKSVPTLFGGLACMAVGSAFATPCLGALVSRYAPADYQGLAMGVFRSMGALSRAIGPLLGGILYWKFGSQSPYMAGAVLLMLPLGLSLGLPRPP